MEALISGPAGVALVMDGGQLASIHVDEPERTVPRDPKEYHYLVGEGRDFVSFETLTRDEVVQKLCLACDNEDALQIALILQDPELPDDIRHDAAGDLEELLQQAEVRAYLEGVLYAHPVPAAFDFPGALRHAREAGTRELLTFLELLGTYQDAIGEVRAAWDSIPLKQFSGEYEHWQATVVREGVFRDLARHRASGRKVNELFVEISGRPAVRALPNYRVVLWEWISSSLQQVAAAEAKASEAELDREPESREDLQLMAFMVGDQEYLDVVGIEAALVRPPGADEDSETLVDPGKLDDAVHFINRKTTLSGLDLAREVGKYIVDNFFGGDYQSFANPSSAKEKSFRALLSREDLILSNTTLYNFVRVSRQLEVLPADLINRLTFSQHRALLPLPDPKRKNELARRALAEGWTSSVLAAEVSKLLPVTRRGRKPSPLLVRTMCRVAKDLESSRVEDLDADELRRLGRQRTAALAAQLEENLAHLTALHKRLHETRIEVWPDEAGPDRRSRSPAPRGSSARLGRGGPQRRG